MAMGGGQAGMRGDDGIPGGEVARDEAITRFLSKKLRAVTFGGH